MKTLLLSLSLLLSSVSYGASDCSDLEKLRDEATIRRVYANQMVALSDEYKGYSEEAKTKKEIASISAAVAGTGMLLLGGYAIATFGASTVASRSALYGIYIAPRVVAGTLTAFPLAGLGLLAGFTEKSIFFTYLFNTALLTITHVDAVYMVGRGVYNLVIDDKVFEIQDKDFGNLISERQKEIQKLSDANKLALKMPPGFISNTLSLGKENVEFYGQLATNAAKLAKLSKEIEGISKQRLSLLESACK